MKTRSRWNALPPTRFFTACGWQKRVEDNPLRLTAGFALALFAAPLRADNVQILPAAPGSEVTIKVSTPATSVPRFGFAPMRVTIENAANQERTWRAVFQVGSRQQFPGLASAPREFTVPAGQTRETWVYVPIAEPSTNAGSVIAATGSTGGVPGGLPPAFGRTGRGIPGGTFKVVISQTPIGTKVSTTRGTGPSALTTEQEIDATTGAITTSYSRVSGQSVPPPSTRPAVAPGMEATFLVDQTNGNIRPTMRPLADRTAPAKVIIITAPQPGSAVGATLVSASGALAAPVVVGGTTNQSSIAVEFAGPGVTNSNRLQFSGPPNMQMRPFAVSASLESTARSQLGAVVRGSPNLSTVDVAQLPADWRVWSAFAAVVLTTDEFASLDAGRRAALRGWVGLGGRLWLSPTAAGAERMEKFGAGQITTLAEPIAAEAVASATARPAIDQRMIDFWISKLEVYNATPGLPNASDFLLEKTPLGESIQERPTNNTWLAIFLVTFAAIVGPVNLFVFAPAAKRYRLFLTTPLIALAAALVLGLTILLHDGLGGDGARRALVVLLPGDNQAAVFQEQVSVTGFLPHRTFALADDTQLAVMSLEASDPRMNGMMIGSTTEFIREEGRGGGDWFRSRGRQAQLAQRLVPTRGRIERAGTAPDGAPIVQSSLGTTLREFVWVDAAGKFWTAADLPPGKRVALSHGTSAVGGAIVGGSRRFTEVLEAAAPKTAGHWRAHGGATDLAPIATLDSVRWTDSDVLFAGVLEGGAPESKTEAKR